MWTVQRARQMFMLLQAGEFAQGYDNATELVLTVFVAVSCISLISWLTKRRH